MSFPYNNFGDLHSSERRWFAVRVGMRKEKVVSKYLDSVGLESYVPLRTIQHHYPSKSVTRNIPLISGYAFVKVNRGDISKVLTNRFVFEFVKFGQMYRQIKAWELKQLRDMSSESKTDWFALESSKIPAEGTLMEVSRGPLTGLRGYFRRQKSKNVFVVAIGGLDTLLATCEINARDLIPLQEVAVSS